MLSTNDALTGELAEIIGASHVIQYMNFCHSIEESAESLCSARSSPTLCPMTAEHQYLSHSPRSSGSGANDTVSCFDAFSDFRRVSVTPPTAFGSVDGMRSSTSRRSKQPVRVRLRASHRFNATRQRHDRRA